MSTIPPSAPRGKPCERTAGGSSPNTALVGPVDWERARKCQAQDDEPLGEWNMRKPDMVLTVDAGLLHDVAGRGPDAMAPLRDAVECVRAGTAAELAAGIDPSPGPPTEEQAIANFTRHLLAGGWTQTPDGHWRPPDSGEEDP